MARTIITIVVGLCFAGTALGQTLRVPGHTAYLAPNPHATEVVPKMGVKRWNAKAGRILWFGEFRAPGEVKASITVRMATDQSAKLKLTLGSQSREATVTGLGTTSLTSVDFGAFTISQTGYHRFELERLQTPGETDVAIDYVDALSLTGPPTKSAHFNLDPRRNAASVHLRFDPPRDEKVAWFYSEVTAIDDPETTFYMACGFHRGYFGMQVINEKERRIIFSVWDAGDGASADNRATVKKENFVSLLAKGDGVHTSVFGGEGTGGHSHLKYLWKTGIPQKFVVTAEPTNDKCTIFAGYYFHPDKNKWFLISRMKAPKDGGYLRGLHGFSENFVGNTGHLRRKALFGNQWIRNADGQWTEITTSSFSHDATGRKDRLDRFMGVESGAFFLSHGGFVPGITKFGEKMERPATKQQPMIELPQE